MNAVYSVEQHNDLTKTASANTLRQMNDMTDAQKFKPELSPEERQARHALQEQTFSIAFESFLEQLADGATLDRICREYHTPITPASFRSWVYRDPRRKQAYMVAMAIGAEAIEDELMRISDGLTADGNPSPKETNRSALRIKTRQWILEVRNPKRYAPVTKIEQTTTTKRDYGSMTAEEIDRLIMEKLGVSGGESTVFDNKLYNPEDGYGG